MANKFGLSLILVILISWEAHAAVNCTATGAGRFADSTDTTCQNYTLCVYVSSSGTYLSYNYTCPGTSVFNPASALCTASSNYVCNVTNSNTTSTSDCTAEGFFPDPNSSNCSSYIECVNIDGTYEETTYTCPDSTYFNPNTTLCESGYSCPSTITFTCTTAGRFADFTDTTCKTYYFCVLNSDGIFLQYTYQCPSTSVFNPSSRLCTTSYVCISYS